METDKHYFLEGLFIIALTIAAAFAFVWLAKSGERDDVRYRIRFTESVSGLNPGEAVKFHGVDIGRVKEMTINPEDPTKVVVEVSVNKDAPIKTDTKAQLRLKGFTGNLFVELNGGSAKAQSLLAATPQGQIPEIPSEKSKLTTVLDELPKVIEKFSSMETKATKVLSDVGQVTGTMKEAAENVKVTTEKVKENPSLLLRRPRKSDSTPSAPEQKNPAAKE